MTLFIMKFRSIDLVVRRTLKWHLSLRQRARNRYLKCPNRWETWMISRRSCAEASLVLLVHLGCSGSSRSASRIAIAQWQSREELRRKLATRKIENYSFWITKFHENIFQSSQSFFDFQKLLVFPIFFSTQNLCPHFIDFSQSFSMRLHKSLNYRPMSLIWYIKDLKCVIQFTSIQYSW